MPSSSTAFLQALGRATGSASRISATPAACSRVAAHTGARRALDQHALAHLAQRVEGGAELVGRRQGHGVAEPRQGAVGQLAAIHEEIDMAVAMQQREAQRERRARHVAAAHVQQPGDRIGAVISATSAPLALTVPAMRARLAALLSPANSSGCGSTGASGAAGRSGHTASTGLESTGTNLAAGALAGAREALVAVDRLQPGIEAELAALGQVLGDPRLGDCSGIWCGTKASVSTWLRTASV